MRRETEEGLRAFRERQKGGEAPRDGPAAEEGEEPEEEGESWGVGRKRKRVKERDVKGLRRKVSMAAEGDDKGEELARENEAEVKKKKKKSEEAKAETASTKPPEKKSLALVGYESDSDEDD